MSVSEKMENWSEKSVGEIGLVRKTSSAYRTQKFRIEKFMPPPIHHLGGHGRLRSKLGQLVASQ
jgi:hypothetical protein